eukprot:1370935-Amphidinium_carterae.1
MQRIVRRRQQFDITQQELLAQRYHEEYSSGVAAQLESVARFEHHLHGQLTHLETNLQDRYTHAEQALQERLTHADTTHATTNLLRTELDQARRQHMTQMKYLRSELHDTAVQLTEARNTTPPEEVEQVRALDLRVENLQAERDIFSSQSQSRSLDSRD